MGAPVCEWCGEPIDLADVQRTVKVPLSQVPAGVELPHSVAGSFVVVTHARCWEAVTERA